jgi:hypothetical protein
MRQDEPLIKAMGFALAGAVGLDALWGRRALLPTVV